MKWGIKAIDWGVAMRGVVFVGGVVVLSVKWRDGAATVFNDLAFGMLAVIVGFHLGANMALRTKDSTIVEGGCRGMGQRAGVELAEMGEPTGNRVDEKVKKVVKETTKKTETQAETETETETETEILRDLFQSTPHLVGICELHESDDGLFDILAVWENRSARPENPPRSLRSSYSQSYVDKWIEVYSDSIRLKIPMSFKMIDPIKKAPFAGILFPLQKSRHRPRFGYICTQNGDKDTFAVDKFAILEERIKTALENQFLAVYDYNFAKRTMWLSRSFSQLVENDEIAPIFLDSTVFAEKYLDPRDVQRVRDKSAEFLAKKSDELVMEHRIVSKTGKVKWVYSRGKPVEWDTSGEPTRLLGVLVDVSERVETQEQLEIKNKELQAALEKANVAITAKANFLANMSHEIRTPLNGVLGHLYLLQSSQLADEQIRWCHQAQECSEHLLDIVNDVLDFSKMEAGKMKLSFLPTDLQGLLEETWSIVETPAKTKGLAITKVVNHDVPSCICVDQGRLKQILVNLLGNSVKFTSHGSVELRVKLLEGTKLQFEVADTGIGIEEKDMGHLFRSFSQVDSSSSRTHDGTGLGLAISRRLVELMGGTICCTSIKGEGSVFAFTVENRLSGVVPVERKTVKNVALTEAMTRMGIEFPLKILVAEDNLVNQMVVLKFLEKLGYDADVVVNGQDAILAASGTAYDVILMDIQMPVVNGLDATRSIRKIRSDTARPVIIAQTANALEGDMQRCLDAGMDDYLSKPMKIDQLAEKLRKWAIE